MAVINHRRVRIVERLCALGVIAQPILLGQDQIVLVQPQRVGHAQVVVYHPWILTSLTAHWKRTALQGAWVRSPVVALGPSSRRYLTTTIGTCNSYA
jgi:hypothetical protein